MNEMSVNENTYRLGRRPGEQGPRTPAETAGLDKSSLQTSSQKQNPSPSSSPPIRKRRLLSPERNNLEHNKSWPHFLILHSLDQSQPLATLSPFDLWKDILKILKEKPKQLSKLASGDYLIEVDKPSLSSTLRQTRSILNIPISVIPHKTLNTSKGIIRCRDITMCSDEEILENLLDQGVTNVRRIRVKRNGSLVATNTYILEFNNPNLPTAVKVAWLNIEVEEYVPNPLRCFKCQLYGHHKDRCARPAVCGNCGQIHSENPCPNPSFCIHCKEPHPASDRNCSTWKTEKEILAVRNRLKIPHPEARKIVAARTPKNKSYASTMKTQTATASTQTDASTNTPFIFQANTKTVSTNIPKTSEASKNTNQSSQPHTASSRASESFKTVSSKKQKWRKGVNSPKSQKTRASPSRRNPRGMREAILAKNQFEVLANLEGMEVDNSQPHPSPSPKSTPSRSPRRGPPPVGTSQQHAPVDPSQKSQGSQGDESGKNGEVVKDHPQADVPPAPPENTDNPISDSFEGFGQCVVDESNLPPRPTLPVPAIITKKVSGTTDNQIPFQFNPVTFDKK